jgi:hypothetical protein
MGRYDSLRRPGKKKQHGLSYRNPRLAEGLKADVHSLLQQLQRLEVMKSQLSYRHHILLGLWLASRQATHFVRASIWPSTNPSDSPMECPAVNPAVALEDILLQSLGPKPLATGNVSHDPLKAWLPAQASPGSSESIILNCINQEKLLGSSEASLLDGTPLSLLLTILLCLCYDEKLVSAHLNAREPGVADTMKAYDKVMEELNEFLVALKETQPTPEKMVELYCSIIARLVMSAAGVVMGALLFPASGLNTWTFTRGEQYLPPDALLDRWVRNRSFLCHPFNQKRAVPVLATWCLLK